MNETIKVQIIIDSCIDIWVIQYSYRRRYRLFAARVASFPRGGNTPVLLRAVCIVRPGRNLLLRKNMCSCSSLVPSSRVSRSWASRCSYTLPIRVSCFSLGNSSNRSCRNADTSSRFIMPESGSGSVQKRLRKALWNPPAIVNLVTDRSGKSWEWELSKFTPFRISSSRFESRLNCSRSNWSISAYNKTREINIKLDQ